MKHAAAAFAAILVTLGAAASAQSLKATHPYPLQAGENQSATDNFLGTQYWYFYGGPGKVAVHAKFTSGGLFGNPMRAPLAITLSDAAHTWSVSKTLVSTSVQTPAETTFTAAAIKKRTKIIVAIAPPAGGLVRTGGAYEVDASGAVTFDPPHVDIVGTYYAEISPPGADADIWKATRFNKDGTVLTSDGTSGTWSVFDPDQHIYTVMLGGMNLSVQATPGRGLTKTGDPSTILFQETK